MNNPETYQDYLAELVAEIIDPGALRTLKTAYRYGSARRKARSIIELIRRNPIGDANG